MKKMWNRIFAGLLTLTMTVGLTACGSSTSTGTSQAGTEASVSAGTENTVVSGPVKQKVHIAYNGEPESFDPVMGTAVATRTITRNVFEGLLEMDANYEVQCQLCESYEVSDDGKTWTFHLRKDVPFHNGDIMTADDVVASLNYWADFNSSSEYFENGARFEKVDDSTVAITFDQPKFLFKYFLSGQTGFAAIMPQEAIESAGDGGITEFIGTGPYKWVEYTPTQNVKLELFEDYVGPDYESNGGDAGNRVCTIPVVYYDFVTDSTTRLSGVTTGQYDIATNINYDNIAQAEATPTIQTYQDWMFSVFIFMNQKLGAFTDEKLRKAVRLGTDVEEMAASAIPNKDYYKITGSFDSDIFKKWYVESAESYVGIKDLDEAKKLVQESSYDGSELRLITTDAYPDLKAMAMVLQQQLSNIGINCKVESYDWATTLSMLWTFDPAGNDNYDIYVMSYPFVSAPVSSAILTNPYSIAYADLSQIAEPMEAMQSTSDESAMLSEWEKAQTTLYEKEMLIKLLDEATVTISTDKVSNLHNFGGPILWGTTVTE
ncbi:MAG: ABC transporter substrate-binding protein [Lachnospiraceae bacterium]